MGAQGDRMSWNNIRLELAYAIGFPQGSPHRCYLLHLPLKESGFIDGPLVCGAPKRATVRRFWPSQPDMRGYVVNTPDGWAFSYEPQQDDETVFQLDTHSIRIDECITVTELDGERLPYRVTNVQQAS